MATQLGVRDSNEASWTQVLEVLEFMNDACSLPILVDADTGYGNFNNARRLVRKLEDRGIAGMYCRRLFICLICLFICYLSGISSEIIETAFLFVFYIYIYMNE